MPKRMHVVFSHRFFSLFSFWYAHSTYNIQWTVFFLKVGAFPMLAPFLLVPIPKQEGFLRPLRVRVSFCSIIFSRCWFSDEGIDMISKIWWRYRWSSDIKNIQWPHHQNSNARIKRADIIGKIMNSSVSFGLKKVSSIKNNDRFSRSQLTTGKIVASLFFKFCKRRRQKL